MVDTPLGSVMVAVRVRLAVLLVLASAANAMAGPLRSLGVKAPSSAPMSGVVALRASPSKSVVMPLTG